MLARISRFDLSRIPQYPVLYGLLAALLALVLILLFVGRVPVSYNVRNLVVRWWITTMMVLAFVLVVGLMTVMMAFVSGMDALTGNSGQPGNIVVFSSGANDEGFSNLALSDVSNLERTQGIAVDEAGQRLASKEVYVIVNQDIPVPKGSPSRRRFVQVRGLEDAPMSAKVHGLELLPGSQWFSEAGVEQTGDGQQVLLQCVMGKGIAGELGLDRPGKQPLAVGEVFRMADREWKVVGLLNSTGSTYDSEVWAKRQIVGERFGKEASYSSFVMRASDIKQAPQLAETLKKSKEVALNAMTEESYFESLSDTSRTLLWAIRIVAGFMALGGNFWRHEHDVRRDQSADQRHRRAASAGLFPHRRAAVVPDGIDDPRAGGRAAGLPVGVTVRWLDRQEHGRWSGSDQNGGAAIPGLAGSARGRPAAVTGDGPGGGAVPCRTGHVDANSRNAPLSSSRLGPAAMDPGH